MCKVSIFKIVALFLIVSVCGCQSRTGDTPRSSSTTDECPTFPHWTYEASFAWPRDHSLSRPEDGKALADGRILVSDEAHGLRVIEADGTNAPFGQFAQAGYTHNPPDFPGGASAVFIEEDGRHVLVGEVYTGEIYRVNVQTQATTVIYDHPFGLNGIDQDSRGTIWFTQSTTNTPEQGAGGLFGGLNLPLPTGAVFRLVPGSDGFASTAEAIERDLYFANGIAIDNTESFVYVSELMMDRVLRFDLDAADGTLSGRVVYQHVLTPDNLAVDDANNLWIASPISNTILVVDACGSAHTVFRAPSVSNAAISEAWSTRSHLGQPRLELVTPDAYSPLPGFLTGMFWSDEGKTVYFSGLGDAILRYPMP